MAISSRIPVVPATHGKTTPSVSPPPEGLGWCIDLVNGKNCKFLFCRVDTSGRAEYICMNQPPLAGYKNAIVAPFDGKQTLAHWCGNYVLDTDTQSPITINVNQ